MRFTSLSCQVSLVLLGLTAVYTLLYSGLSGLLFSAAVGLLLFIVVEPFELVVASTVLFALFYTSVLKKFLVRLEPFQESSEVIRKRVASLGQPSPSSLRGRPKGPTGVYSAASVEGFEDVQPDVPKEGASSDSSAADANPVHQVDPKEVAEITSAPPKKPAAKQGQDIEKEEFQSATNELFKLGKMPSEHKEGPLLDAGQTVMKAMSSLDPNTISAMTADTKKLLETQKGLMSMLNQM
ncbi:hypothetical protein EBX93_13040, partial [bacterium]|nr:hypothetical protein [bacterium]